MTISPQMRKVGLAGLAVLIAALAAKMLLLSGGPPVAIPIPEPVHHATPAPAAAPHHARHTAALPHVDPTLPAALRHALEHHAVVVAVLYAPRVPGDAEALESARKGAQSAHAGFAVLNVRSEAVAKALALKLPGSSDPSVLVVRRPGKIDVVLRGYADADVVAQAARR